jgi:hypothetical protein
MAAPSGRVYSAYDRAYEHRPEIKKKHAERLKARRHAIKLFGKAAVQGMDVDHMRSLKAGGTTTDSNIRLRSIHANRSDKSYYN